MIHPGGILGQRLSSKVKDLMLTGNALPLVFEGTTMEEAVKEIDRGGLGATLVLNQEIGAHRHYHRRRYPAHARIQTADIQTPRRRRHDKKPTNRQGKLPHL